MKNKQKSRIQLTNITIFEQLFLETDLETEGLQENTEVLLKKIFDVRRGV